MRPTLRMHWPSTLQRHTITGVENEDESVREGTPAAWNLLSGKIADICFCAHLCRYVCEGAYSSVYVAEHTQSVYRPVLSM